MNAYNKTVGSLGQKMATDYYIKQGWLVFDVDSVKGQFAPMLTGLDNRYRLPDLLLLKKGGFALLEIKTQPDERYRFRISREQYEDYLALKKFLGWEEFTVLFINCPNGVFKMHLAELERHCKGSNQEFYYFPIPQLKELK